MLKEKLKLNVGDTLKNIGHRSKGFLAETDICTYSIINSSGEVVGTVEYTDHSSVENYKRTQRVVQRDASGEIIVDENW